MEAIFLNYGSYIPIIKNEDHLEYGTLKAVKSKNKIKQSNQKIREIQIYFIKENTETANKHTKRCSISLAIREIQIKIMRCHYAPTEMVKIFK